MGGLGSGRVRQRPLAEEQLQLRIAALRPAIARACAGQEAVTDTITWSIGARVLGRSRYTLRARSPMELRLELAPDEAGRFAAAVIAVVATPQPKNRGLRWWLQCAGCQRHVMVLCAGAAGWRCPRCAKVIYRSSCASDKRLGPLLRAIVRGATGSPDAPLQALDQRRRSRPARSTYTDADAQAALGEVR
ncbi:hypothetical protein K2Z83_28420, partial [Oscillochloris sp. ZM17-4]|uniref:PHD finger domain-containing protein n=1 Tax=Oscillochloris sp. ZM17-4 TaxID=2866714 RepID=UPI001C734841